MAKLIFKYKLLLIIFFLVLLTSLWYSNIYILVLYTLLSYLIIPLRKYWDKVATMLFLFSFFYSLVSILTNRVPSGFLLISYLFAPVSFYRTGMCLMSYFNDDETRQKLLLTIITCYLLPLFITTYNDIVKVGIVNVSRAMESNDGSDIVATLYGLMASVGIGGISGLFVKKQNYFIRIGYLLLSLFSVIVVVHLVNRSGLIVFLGCVLISFILSNKLNLLKVIVILTILGAVIISIVNGAEISVNVLDAYQQRELDSTHDTAELGGRLSLWTDACKKIYTHPFGWERVKYAHNLWLDIARVGGWLPLFFFLIATFYWFKNLLKIARKSDNTLVFVVLLFNISMFLSSLVEPVIDGSMLFFSLFMMMWGITVSLSRE